jgi:hypothetical protein
MPEEVSMSRYHEVYTADEGRYTAALLGFAFYLGYLLYSAAVAPVPSIYALLVNFFAYFIALTVVLHISAREFGGRLSRWQGSKKWVKAFDYLYMAPALLGSIKAISALVDVGRDDMHGLNALIVVSLASAIALRLTKTSIEVFGWDDDANRANRILRGTMRQIAESRTVSPRPLAIPPS